MTVYLIGGPPKCGKTTLAKVLSEKIKASWISADTLQDIVKKFTPETDFPALFPSSNHRTTSNDERFTKYDADALVGQYAIQAKSSYPAIEAIAETYLTDEDSFIIEGYQVTPEIVSRIQKTFGNEHVRAAFLLKRDEEKMLQDFHKSTTPNDWILRRTKDDATFAKIAKMIAMYAEYTEKEAKKYNVPVFEMDSDFSASLERTMKHLMND